jgi:hypothetical protein
MTHGNLTWHALYVSDAVSNLNDIYPRFENYNNYWLVKDDVVGWQIVVTNIMVKHDFK